ncbi:MAG: ASKHA domain-containing protein [Armatimonadota bacterium]|nr:ASKHA domain-containing protein [bacterium]
MKKCKLVRVLFQPDGMEVFVPAGTLLSRAASAAGRAVEMPCGGMGTCGKCRVVVSGIASEPDSIERERLSQEELASGIRLACRTTAIGEVSITIPEANRSMVQKILSQGVLRDYALMSGVNKIYCELSPPSLDDEHAEFERLAGYLETREIKLKPNLAVLRSLSSIIRASNYKVTAVVHCNELIGIEQGNTVNKCLGVAYDLGSTTIVGYMMDLNTGEELATSSVMNPQAVYGDDLVSRISFATTQDDGAHILQSSAIDALNRIARDLAEISGMSLENVYKATLVGNTCMTHLLLGIDVSSLGQSPYVPTTTNDITLSAREIGLEFCPEAKIVVLPGIAGFVGSDTVGVLLASMHKDNGHTRLAVDIGTNGEMALMRDGRLYVCSAAAGPAFEGAGISSGMRGAPGAIDSVTIGEDVRITTIHNKRPIGICGSGLVDAVAQMLDAGIIDESGRMISPSEAGHLPQALRARLIETQRGVEFVLAANGESGTGTVITLTSGDIRHLQLAKGSIHAAIQTLIATAGATDEMLDQILLAGAFGNYIRVESAIRIGLIPAIDVENVVSIGNAAGAGARLALLSEREMQRARELAAKAEHLELAVSPQYQMELMERMMFPAGAAGAPIK